MKKISIILLALMLTLTLIFVSSCGDDTRDSANDSTSSSTVVSQQESPKDSENSQPTPDSEKQEDKIPAQGIWKDATYRNDTSLGQGEKVFTLIVVAEDKEITLTVKTDAKTVGDALTQLHLIEGEEGLYGIYIKKVNGITADYDIDQTYWAFYINGEYASTGADKTDIVVGATYKLSREK